MQKPLRDCHILNLHSDMSYCSVYYGIIKIIILLTTSCFYENLDNSSSL